MVILTWQLCSAYSAINRMTHTQGREGLNIHNVNIAGVFSLLIFHFQVQAVGKLIYVVWAERGRSSAHVL